MTREEFDLNHAHNVFTRNNGYQCQVTGFDEKNQLVDIQYLCTGLRSSITAARYLYEVTVLASDLQDLDWR